MNSSHVSVIATAGCLTAWAAKSLAIGTAGGLGKSPFEGPLFFVGLACYVVAVVALSLAITRGRPTAARAAGAVAGVAVGAGLSVALAVLVESLTPVDPSWVWSEVNLWLGAAVLLGVALVIRGRDGELLTT